MCGNERPPGAKKPRRKACSTGRGSGQSGTFGAPNKRPAISKRISLVIACPFYRNVPITYDEVILSGSRAAWPEGLAVYAVQTASASTNGQRVVTMNDEKKGLLKQEFWDMNELSSYISTVPDEDNDRGVRLLWKDILIPTKTPCTF